MNTNNLKTNINLKNGFYIKGLRLKKLNVGYPLFKLPNNLIDEVNLDEFVKDEENRLPLFIGSPFGVYPKLESVFKEKTKSQVIVVLSKSLLSGHVAGLYIYLYSDSQLNKITSLELHQTTS